MKAFFREFKQFISKGNVLDLAVGVIIGGAFTTVVKSLTDYIIKPLIACIGGAEVQGKIHLTGENYIDYGAFISDVVNFLLMAMIVFLIVRTVNKLTGIIVKKETEPAPTPTTKICPYCKSEIPVDALRCAHCTSQLSDGDTEE